MADQGKKKKNDKGGTPNRRSNERKLYDAMFPKEKQVLGLKEAFGNWEAVLAALPERVRLSCIDSIFAAWVRAEATCLPEYRCLCSNANIMSGAGYLQYNYDTYTYLSKMKPIFFRNGRRPQLNIKLSNDGFLYPPASTLKQDPNYDDSREYHGTTGWCCLHYEELYGNFPTIVGFAAQFFETDDRSVAGEVMYNFTEERMDFRFRHVLASKDSIRLVITFEKGHPYIFHEEDNWGAQKPAGR